MTRCICGEWFPDGATLREHVREAHPGTDPREVLDRDRE